MALLRKKFTVLTSGAALTAIVAFLGVTALQDRDQATTDEPATTDQQIAAAELPDSDQTAIVEAGAVEGASNDASDPAPIPVSQRSGQLNFSLGSIEDLRDHQLTDVISKIENVPGVDEQTKVWIAMSDVASAPGVETLLHIKGPLTCGRAGCELVVRGVHGGVQSTFLETVGESIDAPQMDTLIINHGTEFEVTWVFDGEKFVRK